MAAASRKFFTRAQPGHERALRAVNRNVAPSYVLDQRTEPRQIAQIQQPLLTVEDARDVLNLSSIWAVYRLVAQHALPVRRLGRALRFDQRELEAWTRRQRQDDRERLIVVRGV